MGERRDCRRGAVNRRGAWRGLVAAAALAVSTTLPAAAQLVPVQVLSVGDGLPQSQVTALARDRLGYLWVGTRGGLSRFNGDTFSTFTVRDGLPANRVHHLTVDSAGRLWIGTGGGVSVVEDHALRPIRIPGIEGEWCGALLEGPGGRILVGTEHGVQVISKDTQHALPVPEGLPPEFVPALARYGDGVLVAYQDRIVHWTAGGATRQLPSPGPGWSALHALVVRRGEIWAGGGAERNATFSIAVLGLRDHSRCGYRAKMEGVDEDWLPLRSLPITVTAPIWANRWFPALPVLLVALALLAGYRWRMAWLRRRARELEAQVDARTKELQKLAGKLEHLANHDPLTGLPNRRLIWRELQEALRPREGRQRRCGVLLVDLDRFKEVNDSFGHTEGDRVLQEVARLLRESIRPQDMVGRFGGDEFLVVLPGAGREAIDAVTQRVAAISIPAGDGRRSVAVTISVGAVAVRGGDTLVEPESALLQADELAYQVKKAGRAGFRIGEAGEINATG